MRPLQPSEIIALAALFVATIGFFQGPILNWLLGPRLSVEVEETEWLPLNTPDGIVMSYWVRLRLTNDGQTTARAAQIMIERVFQKRPDGSFVPNRAFLPMCLRWSHFDPPRVENDLVPGFSRRIDLVYIRKPDLGREPVHVLPPANAVLQTEVQPTNYCNVLPPGVYEIIAVTGAANASARRKRFLITVTGKWVDGPGTVSTECLSVTAIS